jgi:copper chaperone CopZ
MKFYTLEIPAMFGDHHVSEVRRLLTELPGVGEVYASSSFRTVEIQYDDKQVDPEKISLTLAQAGYLDEMPVPAEWEDIEPHGDKSPLFFRNPTAYTQTGKTVAFSQSIPQTGRPVWPCPGLSPVPNREEPEHA